MGGGAHVQITISANEEQALAAFQRLSAEEKKLLRTMAETGEESEKTGKKAEAAAAAAERGFGRLTGTLLSGLKTLGSISKMLDEILEKQAGAGAKTGSTALDVSASLRALGVKGFENEAVTRGLLTGGGTSTNAEIADFMREIRSAVPRAPAEDIENLNAVFQRSRMVTGDEGRALARMYAVAAPGGQVGKPGGPSIEDLAEKGMIFGERAGGEFGDAEMKAVQALMGQKIPMDRALAIVAELHKAQQVRAASGIATALGKGAPLEKLLAGEAGEAEVRTAVRAARAAGADFAGSEAAFAGTKDKDLFGEEYAERQTLRLEALLARQRRRGETEQAWKDFGDPSLRIQGEARRQYQADMERDAARGDLAAQAALAAKAIPGSGGLVNFFTRDLEIETGQRLHGIDDPAASDLRAAAGPRPRESLITKSLQDAAEYLFRASETSERAGKASERAEQEKRQLRGPPPPTEGM